MIVNDKKVITGFILGTLLVFGGGVYVLKTTLSAPQLGSTQNAKISVDQKTHDWGTIPYSGGNVSKTFLIKNIGADVLRLANIKTSCSCTKAQVVIDGKNSPFFSMHSNFPWVGEVDPSKEASLTVIFDPAFHGPSGVGAVERLVAVETNDITSPKLEFSLKGVVVK